MTAELILDGPQSGWMKVYIAGVTTAGGACTLGSIANPEGVALQITDGFLYTVIDADAAATLDIGIGVTGADSTNLCSAYDINGAAHGAVIYIVGKDAASEAAATTPKGLAWAATTYLNFYNPAAQISSPWEGYLYLRYIRVGQDVTRA
jgi:hypothetical protein